MKKFRAISALLAICLLLCSCGGNGANPPKTPAASLPDAIDPETVTLLVNSDGMGDTYQALMDHISETVNDVLSEKGYSVRLKIVARSGSEVRNMDKMNYPFTEVVLDYDLFCTQVGTISQLATLAENGMAADITGLVTEHEDLYNAYLPGFWREVTVDGHIYAIPTGGSGRSEGVYQSGILIRSDIVEALGADMPETIDELYELCLLAKDAGMDYELAYDPIYPPWAFQRTYDEWPFYVDMGSRFIMHLDGTLDSYPHSDIFIKDTENLRRFYDNGLMRALRNDEDRKSAQDNWDFLAALPFVYISMSTPNPENIELIQFSPEKPSFSMESYSDAHIFVSSESNKKEAAITLLEAIYTNQEIYDAFLYGEEGVDWILHEDGTREILIETGNVLEHYALLRGYHGVNDGAYISSLPAQEGTVIDFPAASFFFTPSDYDVLQAVQMTYYGSQQNPYPVYGVRSGLVKLSSVKTAIDLMLLRLENAGFDQLLDEAKKQYETFIR